MSEAEAQAVRFTIDHYEPKKARPDLVDAYHNLMYCCDECNLRKGDRCPPADARANGFRFFRPDSDYRRDHFKRSGQLLEPTSNVGTYSIHALDLNRKALRTLRELRERLTECDEHIEEGISALRRFPIDRLPPDIRNKALKYIRQTANMRDDLVNAIEQILREYAKSPLLEEESEPEFEERTRERRASLREVEALFPGNWRGPKSKKA
jgi:hypothetical protein